MKRSVPLIAASVLLLAGCAATPPAEDDGTIRIVASTNVYGDLAMTIGGDLVSVTSIITSAAQDPHSYEASAQDQLALSRADLVIENGGGYDPFIDTLLDAAGSSAVVLTAVDASRLLDDDHDHEADEADDHGTDDHAAVEHSEDDGHNHIEGFNEHVWYSLHGVEHIAEELAHMLGELDPANAETFDANYKAFALQIEELEALVADIADGQGVAMTEPVPFYLLEEAGFENKTPDAFTEAIEEGADVPPTALLETLALFDAPSVALLAYNEQTSSPETERVRAAADAASVPVVDFTETLPDGQTYVSWMKANIEAIAAAL